MRRLAISTLYLAIGLLLVLFPCSAESSTNTISQDWGETAGGFQMACAVDATNGLIHCWVRNNGNRDLVYLPKQFGYWECIKLEIQEGTNWLRVPWSKSWSFIEVSRASVDPRTVTNRLRPMQIVTNAAGMGYAHKIGRLGTELPMPVSHGTIQINGGYFESPKPGDTFTLELIAFDWSARVLQRGQIKARVSQQVSTPELGFGDPYLLRSRTLTLDSTVIQTFIDRESRDRKP